MIHVISHGDYDGMACVAELREHFRGTKVEYTLTSYNDVDAKVQALLARTDWTELWITDLSCSQEMMEQIDHAFHNGRRVIMCDHHKTSAQYKGMYPWFYHDGELCGAQVTAAALKAPTHTPFLRAVQAWDIWLLDSEWRRAGEDLNRYVLFLGAASFLRICERDRLVGAVNLAPEGFISLWGKVAVETMETLRQKERKTVKQGCAKCVRMTDPYGNAYAFVVAKHHLGQMGQFLKEQLVKNPVPEAYAHLAGCQYMMCLNLEYATVSLRSVVEGFDTTDIAKRHGGGGHADASGFPMKGKWQMWLADWLWTLERAASHCPGWETYKEYVE